MSLWDGCRPVLMPQWSAAQRTEATGVSEQAGGGGVGRAGQLGAFGHGGHPAGRVLAVTMQTLLGKRVAGPRAGRGKPWGPARPFSEAWVPSPFSGPATRTLN